MRAWLPSEAQLAARDAMLQRARELRGAGRLDDALAVLSQLEAHDPRFSRGHQERGHCHVLQRAAQPARSALETAVQLNAALPASWDMLAQLHRLGGDPARAAEAERNLALLRALPVAVVAASSLYADGDLAPAERVIGDFLQGDPDNLGARRLRARIRLDRGAATLAEAELAEVLASAPDFAEARLDYAMALLQQQKHRQAKHQAEHLLALDPAHRDYRKQFAAACIGLGEHEAVIDVLGELIDEAPGPARETADLLLWRADALKAMGRTAQAIADYRAALAADPHSGVIWFSLANLKTYRFRDADITAMCTAEARTELAEQDRIYLCFALGKALEDRERHAAAWQAYAKGNALRQRTVSYHPAMAEACADRTRAALTTPFFAERAGWGVVSEAPIFVVGLPRSGSTLVEQILASHTLVEGTHELPELGRIAGELCGIDPAGGLPAHPGALRHLTAPHARALGERYLAETASYRRLGRPRFVDKMPANAWHIGLIQLILPRATIIDVRRAPLACGFSNFKQLYGGANQEFSYGLEPLGRHYRAYLTLMRHWDEVMPGRVVRVIYEDLVADLETSVRRLLEACELPFDPACLTFHRTRRGIRSPSADQVRRPIGTSGLARWRHYDEWLGPLRTALGDAPETYRT